MITPIPAQPSPSTLPDASKTSTSLRYLVLAVLGSLLSFGLFLWLREGIEDNKAHLLATDHALLNFMHRHQTPWLTALAGFLADLGSPPVIGAVAVLGALSGLAVRRIRGAAWTLPVAVIGAGLLIQVIKVTFQRARPDVFEPLLHETGWSFPSGHSVIAVVVYGLLGYFALRLSHMRWVRFAIGAATVALVLAIGVSRVYVGVHYPTDVLAGWSLGVPWLVGCLGLHRELVRRFQAG